MEQIALILIGTLIIVYGVSGIIDPMKFSLGTLSDRHPFYTLRDWCAVKNSKSQNEKRPMQNWSFFMAGDCVQCSSFRSLKGEGKFERFLWKKAPDPSGSFRSCIDIF